MTLLDGRYVGALVVGTMIVLGGCGGDDAPPPTPEGGVLLPDGSPDATPDATPDAMGTSCMSDADCDDGASCNGEEMCVAGTCAAGEALADGTMCDDSSLCTTGDVCTGGACGGTAVDCTAMSDMCNTGVCNADDGNCMAMPVDDGTACDDTDACTSTDICTAGACAGAAVDCTAMADMCNVGMCNAADGTCVPMAIADGTMCDDGSMCTTGDVCTTGACGGTAVDCSGMDGNCLVGTCVEADGSCMAATAADGATCDDTDNCTTTDVCTGGACAGGAVDCTAMTNMCNVGMCSPTDGTCGAAPVMDGTMCDDMDAATIEDICTDGTCAGRPPWSGIRTFTNCSQEGRNGPTQAQCDAGYMGGTLAGEVTVTGGIQRWTAPIAGTFRIEVWGAQGHHPDFPTYQGGHGARMRGDITLAMGQVIDILVGQHAPQAFPRNVSGGGGGGSFVVDVATGNPLIVAGGGGGARTGIRQAGCGARTDDRGVRGSGSSRSSMCSSVSASARAGGVVSAPYYGSGGAGFSGNGANDSRYATAAMSFTNGGRGGHGRFCVDLAYGGFGGGGSGNGCFGGGGGGGYSGGDGGWAAGGAGSYNSGIMPSNSPGCGPVMAPGCSSRTGHGQVTIDLVP